MLQFLLFLHQLPQNILGFILSRKSTDKKVYNDVTVYYSEYLPGYGVSLGRYIILKYDVYHKYGLSSVAVKHEYGHTRQSKRLGWLYLFVIGFPSLIGCIIDLYFHFTWPYYKRQLWYYNLPWEHWADKLGGVKRFSS